MFKAFNDDFYWRRRSWNKCVNGVKDDLERKLNKFARWRIIEIVARYQMNNPTCEWPADDSHCGQIEIHHLTPMWLIIDEAIELMTDEETSAISKELHLWKTADDFEVLDHHKFTQHLLNGTPIRSA